MPTTFLNEGVSTRITLQTPVDTTGQTIYFLAFRRDDLSAEGVLLGTVPGGAADEPIVLEDSLTSNLLPATEYLMEVWINPDQPNRLLLHPCPGEDEVLVVRRRGAVTIE